MASLPEIWISVRGHSDLWEGRKKLIQAPISVDNEVGGGKDCAHRSQRRSSPRGTDAAMTTAWDACDGGIWFRSSEDNLSFALKEAGSKDETGNRKGRRHDGKWTRGLKSN